MDQRTWFAQQVKDCEQSLYRLANSILRDEDDTQDAAQEAICLAYQKLVLLRDKEKFKPWLLKILANTCYSMLRQRQRFVCLDTLPEQEAPERAETDTPLWHAVLTLPDSMRAVVVLYYYEGACVKEIAAILKLSEANVKTRLSRARKQLKALLLEETQ